MKNNTERTNVTKNNHMYNGRFDNITQKKEEKTQWHKKEIIDKILDMEEKQRRSNIY